MRTLVRDAPVARLATVNPEGLVDVVPVTFALDDDGWLVSAVDHKPKRTAALARVRNVRAHPAVTFLVDHYDDDWSALWWVRVRAEAIVVEPNTPGHTEVVAALAAKYAQYREHSPSGPAIVGRPIEWHGWSATRMSASGPA